MAEVALVTHRGEHAGGNQFPDSEAMDILKAPNGGSMVLVMNASLMIGSFGSYFIALARGQIKAFLPYISDAGSVPPQSGLLTLSLIFSVLCGIFFFLTLRASVNERNTENDWIVIFLNKVAFYFAVCAGLGLLITGAYPLGGQREKLEFLYITLIPHILGGSLAMVGYTGYLVVHLLISYRLGNLRRSVIALRTIFAVILIVSLACAAVPLGEALPWLSGNYEYSGKCSDDKLIGQYTVAYNVSSVAEWFILFSTAASSLTYVSDLKGYYVQIQVCHSGTEEKEDSSSK